ncbi:MAG: SH3 domain-containing protein [Pseudomonadota bacterium]
MIRWVLLLCASLYLVFVLGPDPEPDAAPVATATAPTAEGETGPSELVLETGEVWQIDRVIAPDASQEDETPTLAVATPEASPTPGDAEPTTAAAEPPSADVSDGATSLYVTGTRVNLRAGPSTEAEIVTALTQGSETELLAEAEDGWLQIRDIATGVEGFMSGDFLSTQAP